MAIKITKADGWLVVDVIADSEGELNSAEQHVEVGRFAVVKTSPTEGDLYVKEDKDNFIKLT